jgi:hypothetical protein
MLELMLNSRMILSTKITIALINSRIIKVWKCHKRYKILVQKKQKYTKDTIFVIKKDIGIKNLILLKFCWKKFKIGIKNCKDTFIKTYEHLL